MSTSRISSVAYATDDNGSEAKTASATALPSRSWRAWESGIGAPTSTRLIASTCMAVTILPAARLPAECGSIFLHRFYAWRPSLDAALAAHGASSDHEDDDRCALARKQFPASHGRGGTAYSQS